MPYFAIEGMDGAGKTTAMDLVANKLRATGLEPLCTHHPGATPLGHYIRQLVKYQHKIDDKIVIDELSRQVLYMVDSISFIKTVLEPALAENKVVLADRCSYISAIVYGQASGVSLDSINRILQLVTPPKADRLYVLQIGAKTAWDRLMLRTETKAGQDYFDTKPFDFFKQLEVGYDQLLTASAQQSILVSNAVALDNVIYVPSEAPVGTIADQIAADILKVV